MPRRPFKSYVAESTTSPEYAAALEQARRVLWEATERPCSVGDCVGLFSPEGEYLGGWGPVECPHEEVDW